MKPGNLHARSIQTTLERPRNLPADIIHAREVEWLGELKSRLEAVQVWRGASAHNTPPPAVRQPAPRSQQL